VCVCSEALASRPVNQRSAPFSRFVCETERRGLQPFGKHLKKKVKHFSDEHGQLAVVVEQQKDIRETRLILVCRFGVEGKVVHGKVASP